MQECKIELISDVALRLRDVPSTSQPRPLKLAMWLLSPCVVVLKVCTPDKDFDEHMYGTTSVMRT
jgi:hypothetical protein